MSNNDSKGVERRNFLQAFAAATVASGSMHSQPAADAAAQPAGSVSEDATTADILIEHLIDWDVSHVFGLVGDGINAIIDALRRRQDRIRFIGVRH
jgi:pyruvate dehydrogenase (quinone)